MGEVAAESHWHKLKRGTKKWGEINKVKLKSCYAYFWFLCKSGHSVLKEIGREKSSFLFHTSIASFSIKSDNFLNHCILQKLLMLSNFTQSIISRVENMKAIIIFEEYYTIQYFSNFALIYRFLERKINK